ncbi:dihydroorotase [Candidatus Peregrinibacteria bacterium]|nr:MAG: dihydroorotase [Candidatus Peregrinibacteria bacterium]
MKLIFKSASVVTSRNIKVRDLFVADGKIVDAFSEKEADRILDCEGKFLLPGVIDPHVHFRDPGGTHKEDFESGSLAAAFGGVTTVLDMPNTSPATLTQKALDEKAKGIQGRSHVNYGFYAGASKDLAALKAMKGMVAIKLYMASSTGDLLLEEPEYWEEVFKIAKAKDIPVVVHAEHEACIQRNMGRKGEEPSDYCRVRSSECAREAVELALELRKKIGNRLHIAHLSSKAELELLRVYKHPKLSCEVAPHHLFFTMEDMEDAFLKMNPPLRTFMDVEALWRALLDGTVTCIATDHAPHTREEKEQELWAAPAGVPGVEFALPLLLNAVNEGRLSLERVVALMCEGPAQIFDLKNKGSLAVGMDADLVLVDMHLKQTIEAKNIHSKCAWTPYEFFDLKGWPVLTMVHGQVVVENGKLRGAFKGTRL